MKLKDKVAIITGGCSGIGRTTAILFAEEEAKVVIADVKDGKNIVELIAKDNGEAIFVQTDVSKEGDCEKLIDKTIETYGKIDILVNNAGILRFSKVHEMKEEDWIDVMDINLKGVFLCTKHALPDMITHGKGTIINIASVVGLIGSQNISAYCASKGGIIAFTRAVAAEYAGNNIRVNCICPGPIDTPMLRKATKDVKVYENLVLLKRVGKPEDIAYAALYLASDESSYTTGSIMTVDGGMTTV
jgi:dihydroanticapsin dehydrogenase